MKMTDRGFSKFTSRAYKHRDQKKEILLKYFDTLSLN